MYHSTSGDPERSRNAAPNRSGFASMYAPAVVTSREEPIRGDDGHEFTGYLTLPAAGSGAGMVVVQEIFGVSDYIKDVCARLSDLGYVALAPDLYSRIDGESVIDERSDNALPRAYASMQKLDMAQAARDSASALEHLRSVSEVTDQRAGIIGFCLGGGMGYLVAVASEPDVAVCYYGSAIPGNLDRASDVHCPILFQFGDADEFITVEQRAAVEQAFEGRSHTEFHLHHGPNHAFDNHNSAMFHHPAAAAAAWKQTASFLGREFPA
jgi:carboxymethylenebutenolidase